MHFTLRAAMDDKLDLVCSWIFDTDCICFALDHLDQLQNGPPEFIAIAEFIGGSTWKRHS